MSARKPTPKVRVAVVDDSTFIRKAITRMLSDDSRIQVVGSAGSGEELLTNLERWKPDVVTLDLDMPGIGGLATLDRLTALYPPDRGRKLAVIILSTHSGKGAPLTIEALHRGATDFIDKQRYSLVDFDALRTVLLEKILHVAGVLHPPAEPPEPEVPFELPPPEPEVTIPGAFDVVMMGASTGGPPTIQRILEDLGESVPVPVVIVQHMPVGFTQAFAERLNAYLPLVVREAADGEKLLPDTVYMASAGRHLRLRRVEADLTAELVDEPRDLPHVPSIDVLFASAAREVGRRAIGVLLTGMGRDGAEGMAALRARGGYTLAQDEASCIVFGMPRSALALNAVTEVARPDVIGRRLKELISMPGEPSS